MNKSGSLASKWEHHVLYCRLSCHALRHPFTQRSPQLTYFKSIRHSPSLLMKTLLLWVGTHHHILLNMTYHINEVFTHAWAIFCHKKKLYWIKASQFSQYRVFFIVDITQKNHMLPLPILFRGQQATYLLIGTFFICMFAKRTSLQGFKDNQMINVSCTLCLCVGTALDTRIVWPKTLKKWVELIISFSLTSMWPFSMSSFTRKWSRLSVMLLWVWCC